MKNNKAHLITLITMIKVGIVNVNIIGNLKYNFYSVFILFKSVHLIENSNDTA